MNWEAIGAIANVLAAVGVIATLIYLAIQIRQNTKGRSFVIDPESGAELQHDGAGSGRKRIHYSTPVKANVGAGALTEEESARLHFWFIMTFRRFEGVYFQRDLGIVDAEVIDGFERSHIAILASKSAQEWWANSKEIFNSGFVSYLEDLLEKGPPKSLHPVFRIH